MLILASRSTARRKMLEDAGVAFTCQAPAFDEAQTKQEYFGIPSKEMAEKLAAGKALSIATGDAYIIGSDQTLEYHGVTFSKPQSVEDARRQLLSLKGREHKLYSAVALAQSGKILWSTCETVTLTMRNFSDQFLEDYLAAEANEIIHCVGAYRIEAMGLQLFERIEGGHHAILGMPLLPLLQKLRDHGLIAT
jgi:septum formation protein